MRSGESNASALARWTASAPRSWWRTARSPALRSTSAVNSTARIDAQNLSHSAAAADAWASVKSRLRLAAARAARTSSRLKNAASQEFHSVAARSDPVSLAPTSRRARVEIDQSHRDWRRLAALLTNEVRNGLFRCRSVSATSDRSCRLNGLTNHPLLGEAIDHRG